ncbi:hypothetical protein Scep_010009 [Stephania cephalantha]|uniref:Uncharacterized protein n=1 Tax=Stephania cephalantha TaxID=152367 RepID=A0AAP0JVL1_9MAGN
MSLGEQYTEHDDSDRMTLSSYGNGEAKDKGGASTTSRKDGNGGDGGMMLYLSKTSDRSKKIFKLNQELQSSLMEKNAEKCRFKEEYEKLKEENTMLRDTREMEIRKGILAYKASPGYCTELKDFMIENCDFLITKGWNKYVTHPSHKYPITEEEAKVPDSLDMEEDAGTSTTIQGEDQLS